MTALAAKVLLFAMLAVAGFAEPPTTQNNWGVPDTDNIKSKDGFAQLWLVDPRFADEWQKPEMPRIDEIKKLKPGDKVLVAVIFAGAATRDDGKIDVTYDAAVREPDGSLYGDQEPKGLVGSQDKAPPGRNLSLVQEFIVLEIEPQDATGPYTVEVVVRDNVRKVSVTLKTSFEVEE